MQNVEALAGRKKKFTVSLVDLQLVRQFRIRAPLRTWSNIMVKPSTNKSFQSAIQVDARLPALKENLPTSKSDLTFRQPGSPAGSFPHTPWWHCKYLCRDWSILNVASFCAVCGIFSQHCTICKPLSPTTRHLNHTCCSSAGVFL